jgi:hypothetical protein
MPVTNFQSRSRHGHELLENVSQSHGRDRDRDRDRDYRDSRRSRRALPWRPFLGEKYFQLEFILYDAVFCADSAYCIHFALNS